MMCAPAKANFTAPSFPYLARMGKGYTSFEFQQRYLHQLCIIL